MKKLFYSALAGLSSVPAVFAAAGDANTGTALEYTGSSAETIVNAANTTLQNFLTGAAGAIAGIIIVGLGIWAGIVLVRLLIRAFNTGKGR